MTRASTPITISRRLHGCSRLTIVGKDGAALIEIDLRCDRAESVSATTRIHTQRLRRWVRLDVRQGLTNLPPAAE